MEVECNDSLALLTQAEYLLTQANTIQKIKEFKDLAMTAKDWARRRGLGQQAINHCEHYSRRAMVRLGEMLLATPRAKRPPGPGRGKVGNKALPTFSDVPTYAELGISKREASQAKSIARLPRKSKELFIDLTLSVKQAIKKKKQKPKESVVVYEDVVTTLEELIEQGKKFKTIYADPPWSYGNQATRAATHKHYEIWDMTVDEICAERVPELIQDQAHLHLWTTNAFLFEAKKVMESWGFEYKSILLWVKPQMGIGNYWRVCHEFLLFGSRGGLPMLDARKKLRSWYEIDRGKHSAKPAKFRELVEAVSPGPRLEMFAREAHRGWAAYGNEIIGAEMWNK